MICLPCGNDKPEDEFPTCITYYVNKKRGIKVRYEQRRKHCEKCTYQKVKHKYFLNYEKTTANQRREANQIAS